MKKLFKSKMRKKLFQKGGMKRKRDNCRAVGIQTKEDDILEHHHTLMTVKTRDIQRNFRGYDRNDLSNNPPHFTAFWVFVDIVKIVYKQEEIAVTYRLNDGTDLNSFLNGILTRRTYINKDVWCKTRGCLKKGKGHMVGRVSDWQCEKVEEKVFSNAFRNRSTIIAEIQKLLH